MFADSNASNNSSGESINILLNEDHLSDQAPTSNQNREITPTPPNSPMRNPNQMQTMRSALEEEAEEERRAIIPVAVTILAENFNLNRWHSRENEDHLQHMISRASWEEKEFQRIINSQFNTRFNFDEYNNNVLNLTIFPTNIISETNNEPQPKRLMIIPPNAGFERLYDILKEYREEVRNVWLSAGMEISEVFEALIQTTGRVPGTLMINTLDEVGFLSSERESEYEEAENEEEEDRENIYAGFIIFATRTTMQVIGVVADTWKVWRKVTKDKVERLKIISARAGQEGNIKWTRVGPWSTVNDIPESIKTPLFEYFNESKAEPHARALFEKDEGNERRNKGGDREILNYLDFFQLQIKKQGKREDEASENGTFRGIVKNMLDYNQENWGKFWEGEQEETTGTKIGCATAWGKSFTGIKIEEVKNKRFKHKGESKEEDDSKRDVKGKRK